VEAGQPAWPGRDAEALRARADSGTFDYFTEAINGRSKASRGDFTAAEDDNILVQGVARDANGLGYFGYAYYAENKDKLKALPIVNPKTGKPVGPRWKTVIDGTYQPLARPIFIYVNAKSPGPSGDQGVRSVLHEECRQADPRGEVRSAARQGLQANLEHGEKKVLGTKFGGENKVGLTIEELLKLEAKL
jgi:phosphate transport system substrate-binding protein